MNETQAWVAVVVAIISSIVGPVLVGLIQRRTRKAVQAVRDDVKPISNGYAGDTIAALTNTTEALERIELEQRRQGDQLSETRQDIGGLRSELRTDRRTNTTAFAELRQADRDLHQRINKLHPPTGGQS